MKGASHPEHGKITEVLETEKTPDLGTWITARFEDGHRAQVPQGELNR